MESTQRFRAQPTLNEIMVHQGRPLTWLAKHLGVSRSMVRHIVAGNRYVSRDRALLVANLVGVPVDLIFQPMTEWAESKEDRL